MIIPIFNAGESEISELGKVNPIEEYSLFREENPSDSKIKMEINPVCYKGQSRSLPKRIIIPRKIIEKERKIF